jgi:hypothetical protein
MPAAPPGTYIQFVSNAAGQSITITVHYNPVSDAFDINPAVTAVSTFSAAVPLKIAGPDLVVHQVSVPTGTTNISPAQLAAFGITTQSQVRDLSLAL